MRLQFLLLSSCALLPALHAQQARRPPITGVAYVTVIVSDIGKARQFYGGQLGLPEAPFAEGNFHYLRFKVNSDQYLNVFLYSKPPGPSSSRLFEVAFQTSDAEALRRFLAANHVDVPATVDRQPDGSLGFHLKDPEGNRVAFVQHSAGSPQPPKTSSTPSRKTAGLSPISTRIIHAGFVVHDRAAEDRFYRDLLGFKLYWQGGMKDEQTDWVDMQVPDGTDWLEYMLNVQADATPRVLGVVNHFALGVPKIEGTVDQLQARGWNGTERPQIGRDGKWQLNLYDPDMTRAEIMEFRPVQTPCCSPYTGTHPH